MATLKSAAARRSQNAVDLLEHLQQHFSFRFGGFGGRREDRRGAELEFESSPASHALAPRRSLIAEETQNHKPREHGSQSNWFVPTNTLLRQTGVCSDQKCCCSPRSSRRLESVLSSRNLRLFLRFLSYKLNLQAFILQFLLYKHKLALVVNEVKSI